MSPQHHTHGAWFVTYGGRSVGVCVMDGGIDICVPGPGAQAQREWSANAKLIAAAPELLAACERQLANIDHWLETGIPASPDESRSITEQIRAAIAKAR